MILRGFPLRPATVVNLSSAPESQHLMTALSACPAPSLAQVYPVCWPASARCSLGIARGPQSPPDRRSPIRIAEAAARRSFCFYGAAELSRSLATTQMSSATCESEHSTFMMSKSIPRFIHPPRSNPKDLQPSPRAFPEFASTSPDANPEKPQDKKSGIGRNPALPPLRWCLPSPATVKSRRPADKTTKNARNERGRPTEVMPKNRGPAAENLHDLPIAVRKKSVLS